MKEQIPSLHILKLFYTLLAQFEWFIQAIFIQPLMNPQLNYFFLDSTARGCHAWGDNGLDRGENWGGMSTDSSTRGLRRVHRLSPSWPCNLLPRYWAPGEWGQLAREPGPPAPTQTSVNPLLNSKMQMFDCFFSLGTAAAAAYSFTQSCPRIPLSLEFSARILEWVTMPFSRGSSWPRNRTQFSCTAGRFFTTEPPGKPPI